MREHKFVTMFQIFMFDDYCNMLQGQTERKLMQSFNWPKYMQHCTVNIFIGGEK